MENANIYGEAQNRQQSDLLRFINLKNYGGGYKDRWTDRQIQRQKQGNLISLLTNIRDRLQDFISLQKLGKHS
jgi:hypothetical protein